MNFIKNILYKIPLYYKLISFSRTVVIPYYTDVTLYKVLKIYTRGFQKAEINTRAAAISWQLFLGIFPYTLFFLVLLQYMPQYKIIENYLYNLILYKIIPPQLIEETQNYFLLRTQDISESSRKSSFWALFISVASYIIFATRGMRSLINGLNSKTIEQYKRRSLVKQYFLAMAFTVFYAILLLISLTLLYYTEVVVNLMNEYEIVHYQKLIALKDWKEFFIILIFFFGLSVLYYKGPKIDFTYKEILPGTIITTLLFTLLVLLFGLYISVFTNFNVLYGSAGTILILMILLYFMVFLVLIGNELNIVFKVAKQEKEM